MGGQSASTFFRIRRRHRIEHYGERFAMNRGYRSSYVPVPIKTLMSTIAAATMLLMQPRIRDA